MRVAGSHQLSAGWERFWQVSPPRWARGLAWLYALGWRTYAGVYALGLKRRRRMPVPVIGVGSLWAGGVGKTPITIAIARMLQQAGRHVAVLTHGYGGRRYRDITLIDPLEQPDPAEVGDEAAELRLALPEVPIAVGKWRVHTAEAALRRWSPEVLVLDDGFQHLPLARTLDLVLLPLREPLGNGYCLPAGPLREPPSGLKRADGIMLVDYAPTDMPAAPEQTISWKARTNHQLPLYRASIRPLALLHLTTSERLPVSTPELPPLTVLCAIARPERFIQMTQALGYPIESIHTFPDHHAYSRDELQTFAGKTILTTAKDAVKLRALLPPTADAYALLLEAQLDSRLTERLLQEIAR